MILECICDHAGCSEEDKGFCFTNEGGACYSSVNGAGEKQRGCLDETQYQMQCSLTPTQENSIECCFEYQCNNIVTAKLAEREPLLTAEQRQLATVGGVSILVTVTILVFGYLGKGLFLRLLERRKKQQLNESLNMNERLISTLDGRETTSSAIEDTSGSGKGYANLEERKISKDIKYIGSVPIGKGRYGEVWKASWKGKTVAVKVFPSTDSDSYIRESKIYTSLMLRHPNILTFYATDCKSDCDEGTRFLLVTDYHRYGSLFEFLQVEKITLPLAIRMLSSVISGISHLHSGIVATSSESDIDRTMQKMSIAHRDIKSRNILVKNNLECCIADFGLAVKQSNVGGGVEFVSEKKDYTPNIKVGTRRYMAPEVLNETIAMHDFSAFVSADMYAIGLLTWEVANVTQELESEKAPYMPPFGDRVSADPSFEEMERVVCEERFRPEQPESWQESAILSILARIQKECWIEAPQCRLSILRVKKLLKQCQDLIEADYKQRGVSLSDQMLEMIDAVPPRHEEREKARIAEELAKREMQEEMRRKQAEAAQLQQQYQQQFQHHFQHPYPLQHSPIPHQYPDYYYPHHPHYPPSANTPSVLSYNPSVGHPQMFTSTPLNGAGHHPHHPHHQPQNPHQNPPHAQGYHPNPNFHCKFH